MREVEREERGKDQYSSKVVKSYENESINCIHVS